MLAHATVTRAACLGCRVTQGAGAWVPSGGGWGSWSRLVGGVTGGGAFHQFRGERTRLERRRVKETRGVSSSSRSRVGHSLWVSAGGRGGWNGGTLGGAPKRIQKKKAPKVKKARPPAKPREGPGAGTMKQDIEYGAEKAAAAVAKALEANEVKAKGPKHFRTGVLVRVPNVSPAVDILNSSLKRASRVTPTKGLRDPVLKERNRSAKQLQALTAGLCTPLREYVKGFPAVERLHPFERALLELTLRDGSYETTLHKVNTARKGLLEIGKGLAAQAAKANGPKEAVTIREEGFVKMEKYYTDRGMYAIDELKEIAKTLRRLPVAELQTPTVALVGAPNVGKSSLVRVLSSGTPEVCNYPFTTRGIKMGHFFIQEQRHVVTDTPGLLWRPDEERNKIEMLAIATLEHLPTCVVFVTDLSGLCGTSVSDQLAIRADLYERFGHRRPWLDVMSKSKLVPALGGEMSPDLEGLWEEADEVEARETADMLLKAGGLAVSAEEDDNVDGLMNRVKDTLVKHKATLEDDSFGAFDPALELSNEG